MIYKRSLNWHLTSPKVSGLEFSTIIRSNLREFRQVIVRNHLWNPPNQISVGQSTFYLVGSHKQSLTITYSNSLKFGPIVGEDPDPNNWGVFYSQFIASGRIWWKVQIQDIFTGPKRWRYFKKDEFPALAWQFQERLFQHQLLKPGQLDLVVI
jgi:hypothetical protein